MSAPARTAYQRAGVDVGAGDRAVELLRARLGPSSDLLGGLGGFAAAIPLPEGVHEPVLLAATDGVGTKTELARRLDRLEPIGQDLVAMCADDIVCHGGRPLLFLDYLAVGRLHPDRVATIVAGIAAACEAIGCRLVGGETAEHPGLMDPDAFDLAGFCLGVVERSRLLDGSGARTGDAVLGLASSGLHANGYSLVRALVGEGRLDLDAAVDGRSLGDALLEPTRLYAPAVLSLLDVARDEGWRVGGVAHITGGGLPGNLPRAVGPSLGIAVDPASWPEPRVIGAVREAAGMGAPETRATFNGGIGMAVVVDAAATGRAISLLEASGHAAWRIGGVVDAAEASLSRYAEVA